MRVLSALDRPVNLSISGTALLALCIAFLLTVVFGPGLIAPLPFIAYVTFFGSMLFLAMGRRSFFSRQSVTALATRLVCSFALGVCCLVVGWFAGCVIVDVMLHGIP